MQIEQALEDLGINATDVLDAVSHYLKTVDNSKVEITGWADFSAIIAEANLSEGVLNGLAAKIQDLSGGKLRLEYVQVDTQPLFTPQTISNGINSKVVMAKNPDAGLPIYELKW